MRKPSPSMIVALASLFVALSGVGVAATGGNVILGHANSANNRTSLSAPVAGGKALQVTNNDTSSAASTAVGLNVAAGHAPFTVNSGVKVANLNADRLDGFDSSALQRRVSGNCTTGTAIRSIASDGTVTCQNSGTLNGLACRLGGLTGTVFLQSASGHATTGNTVSLDPECTINGSDHSTTLAAAPSAGDTDIKVTSVDGFTFGEPIAVDTGPNFSGPDTNIEVVYVEAVGTPGANGTGVTLFSPLEHPHPSGATVGY